MKQIVTVILLGLFFNTVLFAQSKTLVFNTQEFAPFNYKKNGKAAGPVVEIINEVCQQIQLKCAFKVLPWRRAQKEVEVGLSDALFVVGKNKKREEWLHFSLPIIKTEYGFFVLKLNKLTYKDISDIQGYQIGVFGPSNTSNSLNKIGIKLIKEGFSAIDITMSYDDVLSFKMLNKKNRGLQAVYSNKDVGNKIIKKHGLKNLKYLGKHKELNYYIAFSKKTVPVEIVEKFNKKLRQMHYSKKLERILEKYSLSGANIE